MVTERHPARHDRGSGWLGALLILVGALFFAGQWFDFDLGQYGWPFIILVPGLLLILGGLVTARREGGGMLPAGSAVTMVGLILLFQNTTALWATWAYAWALIPAAVGVGLWLLGRLHDDPEARKSGRGLLQVGLTLFAMGAFFFEGILGLSGFGLRFAWAAQLWPLLLIGAGLLLLGRNLFSSEPR